MFVGLLVWLLLVLGGLLVDASLFFLWLFVGILRLDLVLEFAVVWFGLL